ncbi:MAG TPA: caspase family protein, partial [Dongiaceae bacterium]|nr:caspase family protein [Dongiaceae bacterium]
QVQGENFLIPVKARIDRESDVDVEAVSADLVLKQMDFAQSAVNIVILDACRNNPLTRSWRSEVKGLAEMTRKPRGSFIAYSTAPGEVAADGRGANSPYATALAQSIVEPGQGIEEIFRDVRAKVLAATDDRQTPWDSSSLTAPFFFQAPVAASSAQTALLSNPDAADMLFWDSIRDSKSPDDYQAYLDKYPHGVYAGLAANRLKALGAASAAVASAATAPDTTERNMPPAKDDDLTARYEDMFWDSVKSSGRAEDIQAYLNKYPHGRYAGDAQRALKDLTKTGTPAPLPAFESVDQPVYVRDRARLRAVPDLSGEVLRLVAANAALKATGKTADGAWWRVAMEDGRTGYIAGSVVTDQPPPPPVPAAATPPAPEASITTPPQQASAAPSPAASAAPASGKDEDLCPSDSKAAPADRVAACQRLVATAGDDDAKVTALVNLGNSLYDASRSDEALKSYQAALQLDPKSAAAYFDIGLIRSDQARYAEARAAFDKAAALEPDDGDAVYQRGVARGNLGDFDGALTDVERAIDMKTGATDVYEELSFLKLAAADTDAAVKAADKAADGDQGYWSLSAMVAYYFGGRMDKAAEQAERSIKDKPDFAYGWVWKSLTQRARGDIAGANQTLGDALQSIKPGEWPAPMLQFMAGKISESRLQEIVAAGDLKTRTERLCETSYYRGELAYLAGDKAAARAAMQVALGTRVYYYVEYATAKARLAQLNE